MFKAVALLKTRETLQAKPDSDNFEDACREASELATDSDDISFVVVTKTN